MQINCKVKMIEPNNYNKNNLIKKIKSGEIGINQISLPDRLFFKKLINKEVSKK